MTEGDRIACSIVNDNHIIEAVKARNADPADRLMRQHTMKLHDHMKHTWIEPADSDTAETPKDIAL